MAFIEFSNVSLSHTKASRPTLTDVSFSVDAGEFVYIVGPSGAGKTSIVKLLLGEITPTRGTVLVDGTAPSAADSYRDQLGYVPQRTGVGNPTAFMMMRRASRRFTAQEDAARRLPELMERVGLGDETGLRFDYVPLQDQRLWLVRALMNRPRLLLLDTPTSGLNPDETAEILKVIDHFNRAGTTVVLVTSSPDVVNLMRRRVLEFELGRLVRDQVRGTYSGSRAARVAD